jgi:hypothetical protein
MLILFILLMLILIYLNVLDALTTYYIVVRQSYNSERNPLVRVFIKRFGAKKGLIMVKSIIIFLLPLIVWCYLDTPFYVCYSLLFLNFLYLFIVFNNKKICKMIDKNFSFLKKSVDKKST